MTDQLPAVAGVAVIARAGRVPGPYTWWAYCAHCRWDCHRQPPHDHRWQAVSCGRRHTCPEGPA